jgi:hypothetical protein
MHRDLKICCLCRFLTCSWLSLPLRGLFLSATMTAAHAQVIFNDGFNTPTGGTSNGTQFQSGFGVQYAATLSNWDVSGYSTAHMVQTGTTDFAPMIYSGNQFRQVNALTLRSGVGANVLDQLYQVSFDISPAVYQSDAQTTQAGDKLLFKVLRSDDSVLSSFEVSPGAWAGTMLFVPSGFSYFGDGDGLVRFVITSGTPNNDRFSGAVDNFSVLAVPEPSTYAVVFGALVLFAAFVIRRRRAPAEPPAPL